MSTPADTTGPVPTEAEARRLDETDPLAACRGRFRLPAGPDGAPLIYFCGNSLGLQPAAARALVEQELDDWAQLAVHAHFRGRTPWYSYHEVFREAGARLVGGRPGEVVMMNGLTVNLHLMMASFYRPDGRRRKILVDGPTFPSDRYAVTSHLAARGVDPAAALVEVLPRAGEHAVRPEDLVAAIDETGDELALALVAGVNFLTGQVHDLARVSAAAHAVGGAAGFDLAHAAGNVPLRLHDWEADFACWCSYKYLNAGPGAVAGCFVHERHGRDLDLPRLAGWWGNDPATRFRMHLLPDFVPRPGADGWQLSNPPILAMAPLRASLDIFDEVGMDALRAKSERLTGFLRRLVERLGADRFEIITPADAQGCQLSILVHRDPRSLFADLEAAGVVGDFREPNVIRVAPAPLYNTFMDAWRFAEILGRHAGGDDRGGPA
ncbi:MAG: kynureninase [Planctomycetota bacterium]|jgi:kynureninase